MGVHWQTRAWPDRRLYISIQLKTVQYSIQAPTHPTPTHTRHSSNTWGVTAPTSNRTPVTMPKGSGLMKPMALSPSLASIVGTRPEERLSRPQVVKKLWAYIKEHNLQDPENKQMFTPDKLMEPVFGKEKLRAFGMAKYLKNHLIA